MRIQSASFGLCFLTIRPVRSDSSCVVPPVKPPLQRSNRCAFARPPFSRQPDRRYCLILPQLFERRSNSALQVATIPFCFVDFRVPCAASGGSVYSHFCLFYSSSPHHCSFCLDNLFTSFLMVSCVADSQLERTQTATSATRSVSVSAFRLFFTLFVWLK